MSENIDVRIARREDLGGIVSCHVEAFPGQFMSEMGPRWLRDLYGAFINYGRGISLVAVDPQDDVLGFAVGGDPRIRQEFLRKAVLRHWGLLLQKSLTRRIVRKTLLAEALRRLHLVRSTEPDSVTSAGAGPDLNTGSLLSIAVRPRCQGRGVADGLMQSFVARSIECGFDVLRLSAHLDNARAISVYRKHGWREVTRNERGVWFMLDLK